MLFKARGKTKVVTRTINGIYRHGIEAGGSDIWPSVSLDVPPVPPSYLRYCNIIDIQYQLKVCIFFGSSIS